MTEAANGCGGWYSRLHRRTRSDSALNSFHVFSNDALRDTVPSRQWSDFTVTEPRSHRRAEVGRGLEVIVSNPPAQAGPEASTQRELQEDAALHVLGCRECLSWRLGIEDMVF